MNTNYYIEIKDKLISNETYKRVKDYSKNRSDLITYYEVGKLLKEAGKHYGEGIIDVYSKKLSNELGRGYSSRNLRNFRQFYSLFEKNIWQTLSAKLTWSHYCELLWINDINKINYYIMIAEKNNLSVRELRARVKSNEYERLDKETELRLINKEDNKIEDFIKSPILIKNSYDYDSVSEKMLKQLILEDLDSFMSELGEGFSYIRSEYKIKIGNSYNYIDLLFYNIKYNCYVVVELKVRELKHTDIGKIKVYMNYVDKNIKRIDMDKTIGIIICKKDNLFLMEYCSDSRILSREYGLVNIIS